MAKSSSKEYCYDHPRPALTVDIVLFHRSGVDIEVLLIKRAREPFKGRWAFPGGFVDKDESLEAAAARELREETGLHGIKLEQLAAFGDPGRDPRGHTVSVVFYGTVSNRRAGSRPAARAHGRATAAGAARDPGGVDAGDQWCGQRADRGRADERGKELRAVAGQARRQDRAGQPADSAEGRHHGALPEIIARELFKEAG